MGRQARCKVIGPVVQRAARAVDQHQIRRGTRRLAHDLRMDLRALDVDDLSGGWKVLPRMCFAQARAELDQTHEGDTDQYEQQQRCHSIISVDLSRTAQSHPDQKEL
mgnify:CR=1 FL=1